MPKIMNLKILKASRLAAAILLVPAAIVAITALSQPAVRSGETVDNSIRQDTAIRCTATILPCALYPGGATITPSGPLIAKITDRLAFDIKSRIVADKPVQVSGNGRAFVRVSADGLWERNFTIADFISFDSSTTDADLYSSGFTVEMKELARRIQKIEEETDIIKTEYKIKIVLELAGQIEAGGKTIPLEPVPEVVFTYNGTTLELAGNEEEPAADKAAGVLMQATGDYTITTPTTTINTLFGAGIPIPVARMIFIPLALLLGGYVGYRPLAGLLAAKSGLSPATRINRKYKNRIVRIMAYPKPTSKAAIEFHSFQEMVHMADQKELPILCYDGGGDTVDYFLIDNGAVYSFKADNHPAAASQSVLPQPAAGKSEQTDA